MDMLRQPHGDTVAMTMAPALPPHAMKTYGIRVPVATHFRLATCVEVDCPNYLHGWETIIDESSPEGQYHAETIRSLQGYGYTVERRGDFTVYVFAPGQRCFSASTHRISLEREPLYIVKGGDWRANPSGEFRQHANADEFVEDFGEHQQRLADRLEQG